MSWNSFDNSAIILYIMGQLRQPLYGQFSHSDHLDLSFVVSMTHL